MALEVPGLIFSFDQPVRQPVPIFRSSLGNNCPRCRKAMTVRRHEDFEVLQCTCGYGCKQQSGEMKLQYRETELKRTAQ